MKKKFIRALACALALMMMASTSSLAAGAAMSRKDKAHLLADSARDMGYGENSAVVKVCQDLWWMEDGDRSVYGSYYYSARTGMYYDLLGNSYSYPPTQQQGSRYHGQTYWCNGYNWTWDSSANDYYRWNGNIKVWLYDNHSSGRYQGQTYWCNGYNWTWDNSRNDYYRWSGNTKVWLYGGSGGQSQQQTGSNNMFAGYNWYAGLIQGPKDEYWDNEARLLLDATYNIIYDISSQTTQAQMMWCALNMAGGGSVAKIVNYCDYRQNAPTTDIKNRNLLSLAYDVVWRYRAENNGITDNGRVLPADYYYWQKTGTVLTFQKVQNGPSYSGGLKSPYQT